MKCGGCGVRLLPEEPCRACKPLCAGSWCDSKLPPGSCVPWREAVESVRPCELREGHEGECGKGSLGPRPLVLPPPRRGNGVRSCPRWRPLRTRAVFAGEQLRPDSAHPMPPSCQDLLAGRAKIRTLGHAHPTDRPDRPNPSPITRGIRPMSQLNPLLRSPSPAHQAHDRRERSSISSWRARQLSIAQDASELDAQLRAGREEALELARVRRERAKASG